MAKPVPVVDASRCDPKVCGKKPCAVVAACPMKNMVKDEDDEPPQPFGPCKGCGKCALACPHKTIVMM